MIYRSGSTSDDRRQRMIDETGAWLTWALANNVRVRIPRRRVADGGFRDVLRSPGARAAVFHWWSRTLMVVGKITGED